jgi:glycine cleavage system aminomethyltransferase T
MGRAALLRHRVERTRQLCCLTFDDDRVAIVGKEPVMDGERVLGYVTSGNYGYCVGQSIFYAYLPLSHAAAGTPVEVYNFGQRFPATVVNEPLFDPHHLRLKA